MALHYTYRQVSFIQILYQISPKRDKSSETAKHLTPGHLAGKEWAVAWFCIMLIKFMGTAVAQLWVNTIIVSASYII